MALQVEKESQLIALCFIGSTYPDVVVESMLDLAGNTLNTRLQKESEKSKTKK